MVSLMLMEFSVLSLNILYPDEVGNLVLILSQVYDAADQLCIASL